MTEVAITIYNEARGDGEDGMRAVAHVIYNLINYKCPKEKCGSNHGLKSWQGAFVGHSTTPPKITATPKQNSDDEKAWKFAQSLTLSAGQGGATHFQRQKWPANKYEDKGQVGKHYFAREKTEETRHEK